jgi:Ca2+-binding RTX toxin-like protein
MTASPRRSRARRDRTSLSAPARRPALALIALIGAHSTATAQDGRPTCNGSPATIYAQDGVVVGGSDDGKQYRGVLRGTTADDVIVGTADADRIKGRAGRDAICGGGGADVIAAGAGDDVVDGGSGADEIKGQAGNDTIAGGDDDDRLFGGAGDDRIDGGAGTNRIKAGAGKDTCINGATAGSCVAATATLTITNDLPATSPCLDGNIVSVFAPSEQVVQPGGFITVKGDFSQFPGIGIQVDNWYWTSVSLPVQATAPQNPDNSGAQFAVSADCVLSEEPAWWGKGIPTYLIAAVTAAKVGDGCRITVAKSSYTNVVTPGCCSPPGIGTDTCTGPWGVTNDGQPWPPQ